jgi:Trypsin-like peptidase domain/Inner membrane component of T3SS, cytoplasmic domain
MRRFYTATIVMLFFAAVLIMPISRSFVASADVSPGERLAMYSKPAVVRIYVGPEGTFVYQEPSWNAAKSYAFNYVVSGSGFFISSNGYIATNAHVSQMWHDGEDKAKQLLVAKFIFAVGKAFHNIEPSNMSRHDYDTIYGWIQGLNNFNVYHHVVIPDGTMLPFEDKPSGYGAPTGESENAKDVSVIKLEVKNAPVMILGDSDTVKVSDTDTVIGYPGVADFGEFKNFMSPKSQLEATFTYGHISATKSLASGAPILQTDANIDHGNSGGPVLNDKGDVIGLATFGKDSQHSFVVTSNTAKEFVNAVGAKNELGLVDNLYREGLDLYWQQHYKEAMPKFEEVKRLFPQHSEVDKLIQSSQQAITEGKDKSGLSFGWLIGGVLVVLFLIVAVIVIAVVVFLLLKRRGKSQPVAAGAMAARPAPPLSPSMGVVPSPGPTAKPQTPYSPSPTPAAAPGRTPYSPPAPAAPRMSMPQISPAAMSDKTMDLSATIAITPSDTAPISYGSIKFISGVLAGQKFEIKPEGACIGRDSGSAQIVLADPRISKRHLWIGVRDGRVAIADQGSRNGTFLNDPKSPRVTEAVLNPGDTVILGESDVARFEYET